MNYFQCGKVQIPLVLCSGMSWARTARTVKRRGGYETAIGFEAVEVSVRVIFSYSVAKECGLDPVEIYRQLSTLVTECTDEPDRLVVGGFEPIPSLEFALTSCNKTQIHDSAFDPSMELDLIFAGVRCKKEVARKKSLSEEKSGDVPPVSITKGSITIELGETYTLTTCIERENSVSIAFLVGDDLTVIERDFIHLSEGEYKISYNGKEYHIISCQIESNLVQVEGSFWPVAAQKPFVHTYRDTTLREIITDIASRGGVTVDCRVDGRVDYYLNSDPPMDAIAALVESCGALSYWRGGKLIISDVPPVMQSTTELVADITPVTTEVEPLTHCVWTDGVTTDSAGDSTGAGVIITSRYRGESKAKECLKRAKFTQNTLQCEAPSREGVEAGSAFLLWLGKGYITALIQSYELDWLTGQGIYYLQYNN